ncbi:putative transferase, protein kinase RLK-Pelle-WAK family [Helianthus annuus]|nr:putative transferase, protein kinase RLK-Pelle-WAK family [Helianthus annuus]KAJ0759822.1 putative transferase, protein kinase RLK-Pelle-WAK family [Helianthus annuus]
MTPEMIEVRAHFQSPNPTLKEVKFADLKKATKNFSMHMRIPPTYVGRVFLAWVEQNTLAPSKERDVIAVAVKRHIPFDKWRAEKNILGQLAHPNIIKLLGYSNNENENLLVYEYMPNKSFLEFFCTETISWEIRLLIMIGVARALAYLHLKNIIHGGLEPSHILLDEVCALLLFLIDGTFCYYAIQLVNHLSFCFLFQDLSAKLGGFGLATNGPETHVLTEVEGRRGYMDPNYQSNGQLTLKSDIYGFGVMLLKSITARSFFSLHENQTLVDCATGIHTNRRNVKEIIDPRLEDNYSLQSVSECFSLAVRCVSNNPADRPSSEEVLQNLEQIHALYK